MVSLFLVDLVTVGLKGKSLLLNMHVKTKFHSLGICLGMQLASIEFARNVLDLEGCSFYQRLIQTTEYPIIDLFPEQKDVEDLRWYTSS